MVAEPGSAPLPSPAAPSPSGAGADVHALPYSRRELFSDERGRGLRASWHPERGVVVLSLWKDDVCAGTVQLAPDDAARLAAFLDAARRAGDGGEPRGADATVPLQVLRGD